MWVRTRWLRLSFLLILLAISNSNLWAQNPVPFVNQPLVPTSVTPGGPSFTLTVNGTGFVSGATINWNGAALSTTFVSASQLTANVPSANIAAAGTASITVVNPAPGGGRSNVAYLQVTTPTAAMAFEQLSSTAPWAEPIALIMVDFSGDGKLDVAITTWGLNVNVGLGHGDGAFGTFTQYNANVVLYGLAAGDFNGDGKLDIVASDSCGGLVVLLGNGDGTFQSPTNYQGPSCGGAQSSVVTGDFNGDGKLDVAVTGSGSRIVSVWLGVGDGTFSTRTDYSYSGMNLIGLVVGDFNGDQILDLAAANYWTPGGVAVMLGDGHGGFSPPVNYASGLVWPTLAATADFNKDGKLDLVTADLSSVSVLLGNGDGTFQSPVVYSLQNGSLKSLTTGDYNGDGKLDLVLGNYEGSSSTLFQIMPGNGDGTFQTPAVFYFPNSASVSSGLSAAGDTDGDGRLDVVTVDGQGPNVSTFLQAAPLDLFPRDLPFGDQLVGTTSAAKTLTLANRLVTPLTISSIALTQANASEFTESSDCPLSPATLASGSSCTMTVAFAPQTTGAKSAAITITDDGPGSPQSVPLTGTGVNPAVALSPTSITFSSQNVGTTSAPQTVTLKNNGTGALTFTGSGISISGTNAADFSQTNNCGTGVAQGASCTISVTFAPTAGGTRTASLTIIDDAASSPQSVSLTGTGVPPTVTLNPTALSFGSYGIGVTSPPLAVTLTNNGPGPLLVTKVVATGDFGVTTTCLGTVAASANCTINVTFTPSTGGNRTGSLTITDDATSSPQTVTLSGTGVAPAVTVSPTSLTFTAIPVGTITEAQVITLTNIGPGPLAISSVTIQGPNASDFLQTNDCVSSLAASASCTINVTFKPTAAGGRTATVAINDNAANSPQTVTLMGGSGPIANLSVTNLKFGPQLINTQSTTQSVTLTNSGNAALTITNVQVSPSFVIQDSTCLAGTQIAANSNCGVIVAFAPAAGGSASGALTITDDAPGSPQTVTLSGTGQDYALATDAASKTITAGQTATFTLGVTPEGGLNKAVTLACSGAPTLSTCAVIPASVTLNGSSSSSAKRLALDHRAVPGAAARPARAAHGQKESASARGIAGGAAGLLCSGGRR
ncbi:MAG: choice-of-anchor D domain-containing protein [Acidobacteriia bacterium]|nr:choice-of-anchor D domain-containing protein [Terriglobia bacterium]